MTDFARVRPAAKSVVDVNRIVRASLRLASFDTAFQRLQIVAKLGEGLQAVHADGDHRAPEVVVFRDELAPDTAHVIRNGDRPVTVVGADKVDTDR